MPFKPWCPVCVKSRGKEDPHYADTKKEKEEKGLPRISIDYAEVGNGEEREDTRKLLVGHDRWTKTTFCHLVQCKGLGDTRISAKVRKSIDRTGNTDMTLKGDGEPALVQVMEDVKNKRSHRTMLDHPPAHDPQANGEAERAVQEVKGEMRTIKLGLEARIEEEIDIKWPILEWIVPHAPDCINRYLV